MIIEQKGQRNTTVIIELQWLTSARIFRLYRFASLSSFRFPEPPIYYFYFANIGY